MRLPLGAVGLSAAIALPLACGASNAASAGPGVVLTACPGSQPATGWQAECASCVQTTCAEEAQAFEQSCADYLSCFCGDAQVADAAIAPCEAQLTQPSCKQALGSIEACEGEKCNRSCVPPDAASGVEAETAPPSDAAPDGDGGAATVTFSCSNGTGTALQCDEQAIPPSTSATASQMCAAVGGVSGTGCPGQSLAGCCRLPTTEDCFYDSASVMQRQTTCQEAGGTWSTSQ